jgi:UDP-glucose 4-epimerase
MRDPADYYRTNVGGTANVIEAAGPCPFVLSSSATIYGDAAKCPIGEDYAPTPSNPYARSRLAAEFVVQDVVAARGGAACLLRYFNPAGAHESGKLGEDPRVPPQNLMPLVEQVAIGVRDRIGVFGDDYPTADGTGVRDYLHVMDLARAHRLALETSQNRAGISVYNVGSGRGYSVLEVISAFERATGRVVPYRIEARRPGDVAQSWANTARARTELGWSPGRDFAQICVDSLRWRSFWLDSLRPPVPVEQATTAPLGRRTRTHRRRPSAIV